MVPKALNADSHCYISAQLLEVMFVIRNLWKATALSFPGPSRFAQLHDSLDDTDYVSINKDLAYTQFLLGMTDSLRFFLAY